MLRSTRIAAMVILSALVLLGVGPAMLQALERRAHREIGDVLLPARALVAAYRNAVERTLSTQAGYGVSGDPWLYRRLLEWQQERENASARLAAMLPSLGPEERQLFDLMEQRRRAVEPASDDRAGTSGETSTAYVRLLSLRAVDTRVDELLLATDALDRHLGERIAERREDLARIGRWSAIADALFAFAGIAAAFAVLRVTSKERSARSHAEAAVRARDEVVSIVSHDLRNPLNAVAGAAASILKSMPPEIEDRRGARKHLDVILRATDSMTHIVSDLLDVARIESDRLAVHKVPVPVEALLTDAASLLEPIVEQGGLRFRCEWPAGLPPVWVDPDRLLQVFSNLIGNAVKFTPPGGSVALTAASAANGVRFSVSDTGAGISPERLPHVFDRFWQAAQSDRRGIGLGLSVVQGIVEAHGSYVHVESAPGHGSTFSFVVPA